ncbi:Hypp4253 [Branchiostoma lanceolatum]|uniref:Hypp4253 protein n=1 Tax=Branchiostoma lanceolatum TaxID=7740 RepID=A0A8K0F0X1_BRALA|nr:Hypp4253 [Branchiostoma lanceolatum]
MFCYLPICHQYLRFRSKLQFFSLCDKTELIGMFLSTAQTAASAGDEPCPEGSRDEGGYTGMCRNGGTCVLRHGMLLSCLCTSEYHGARCEFSRVGSELKRLLERYLDSGIRQTTDQSSQAAAKAKTTHTMRLQSVWNVLLAVGYWCLIHVAKAQIQTEEDVSSTEPRASLGLDMTTKMPGMCLKLKGGCPLEYIGRRCERSVSLETRSGKPEEKNYVIAGAVCGSLIILALVGIICILVSWKRSRRARQNSSDPEKNRPENGHLTEGDN